MTCEKRKIKRKISKKIDIIETEKEKIQKQRKSNYKENDVNVKNIRKNIQKNIKADEGLIRKMKTDYEYLPLSKTKVDIRNQFCYSQNYAHAVHEKHAIDAASVNTPDGTTVLLFIRLKGSLIYILRIKAEELHSDFANIWKNN